MLAKITKLLLLAIVAMVTLSGCNTTRGFGKDVKHLGGAISRVAS